MGGTYQHLLTRFCLLLWELCQKSDTLDPGGLGIFPKTPPGPKRCHSGPSPVTQGSPGPGKAKAVKKAANAPGQDNDLDPHSLELRVIRGLALVGR